MTTAKLTALLAERIMGWRVAPGRIIIGGRGWKPDWRFQPTNRLEDTFRVLRAANPDECTIHFRRGGDVTVSVHIDGNVGRGSRPYKLTSKSETTSPLPLAICLAIARAIGIDVETVD